MEKFNYFVETSKDIFGITAEQYDSAKELEEIKECRDKMIAGGMIIDSVTYLHKAYTSGKRILAEGANANMLDLDHGTYPMVTSSSCTIGGVMTGLGMPP